MYLAKQNKLPSCLQSYFAQASEIHTYEIRLAKRNSFYVTRFNKSVTERSIRYTGVKTWNDLPKDIQNLVYNSNTTFSKKLKSIPPRNTNVRKVCFPFSLLLSFTIKFYCLSMFLSVA